MVAQEKAGPKPSTKVSLTLPLLIDATRTQTTKGAQKEQDTTEVGQTSAGNHKSTVRVY
jgi:hypothetical protein